MHVAEPLPNDNAEQQIDLMTRCTYNLLWAAAEEKVPRVVLLSTLDLMTGYDPKYTVSENWLPLPSEHARRLVETPGRVHRPRIRARR